MEWEEEAGLTPSPNSDCKLTLGTVDILELQEIVLDWELRIRGHQWCVSFQAPDHWPVAGRTRKETFAGAKLQA